MARDAHGSAARRRLVRRILHRLERAYGPRPWRRWGDGVSVLVDTILSQNTSAANSTAGYRRLRRRLRSWKQVMDAPVAQVEHCIAVCGLSRTKAPRIQEILRQIRCQRGTIDLEFLAEMDEEAARDYLMRFRGVGPKTAACTLLFAFGKPLFPVDTHIHRIAIRLGLISPRATAEQAHGLMTALIAPEARYAMHLLLIQLGRQVCKPGVPRCAQCPLLELCPHGSRKLRGSRGRRAAARTAPVGSA